MTIPASLLHHAEQHGCFSGCFGTESDATVCTDARHPHQPVVQVSCKDCLSFKIGTLRSLLPASKPSVSKVSKSSNSETLMRLQTYHI